MVAADIRALRTSGPPVAMAQAMVRQASSAWRVSSRTMRPRTRVTPGVRQPARARVAASAAMVSPTQPSRKVATAISDRLRRVVSVGSSPGLKWRPA